MEEDFVTINIEDDSSSAESEKALEDNLKTPTSPIIQKSSEKISDTQVMTSLGKDYNPLYSKNYNMVIEELKIKLEQLACEKQLSENLEKRLANTLSVENEENEENEEEELLRKDNEFQLLCELVKDKNNICELIKCLTRETHAIFSGIYDQYSRLVDYIKIAIQYNNLTAILLVGELLSEIELDSDSADDLLITTIEYQNVDAFVYLQKELGFSPILLARSTYYNYDTFTELIVTYCEEKDELINAYAGQPLLNTVYWNNYKMTEILLKNGANINVQNNYALDIAITNCNINIIRLLIDYGIFILDRHFKNAMKSANANEILIALCQNIDQFIYKPEILREVEEFFCKVGLFEGLIALEFGSRNSNNFEFNSNILQNRGLLLYAVLSGNILVVKYLLNHNVIDDYEKALRLSLEYKNLDIYKLLVSETSRGVQKKLVKYE